MIHDSFASLVVPQVCLSTRRQTAAVVALSKSEDPTGACGEQYSPAPAPPPFSLAPAAAPLPPIPADSPVATPSFRIWPTLWRRALITGWVDVSRAALSSCSHTQHTVSEIKDVLETHVRPNIQADGGDVEYHHFDVATGHLVLRLKGACVSCASSTVTVRFMIR